MQDTSAQHKKSGQHGSNAVEAYTTTTLSLSPDIYAAFLISLYKTRRSGIYVAFKHSPWIEGCSNKAL